MDNPCLSCDYHTPDHNCMAVDLDACPWRTENGNGVQFPVVTRKRLNKVCYMVARKVAGQPVPIENAFPPPQKSKAWLLATLPVREHHEEGSRTKRIVGCYLFADGYRVLDLQQLPVKERVVKDGVVMSDGTTVYEAVLHSAVPLERALAVLVLEDHGRGIRGTLYRLPEENDYYVEEEKYHAKTHDGFGESAQTAKD